MTPVFTIDIFDTRERGPCLRLTFITPVNTGSEHLRPVFKVDVSDVREHGRQSTLSVFTAREQDR